MFIGVAVLDNHMWSVGFKVLKVMTRKISVLLGVICATVLEELPTSIFRVPLIGGSITSQNTSIS